MYQKKLWQNNVTNHINVFNDITNVSSDIIIMKTLNQKVNTKEN